MAHPIGDGDCVVRLWENHSLLGVEEEILENMLLTMRRFVPFNMEEAVDFSGIEERLNIVFPRELNKSMEPFTIRSPILPQQNTFCRWMRSMWSKGFWCF